MTFLKAKNILVISPEAWGKSKLSKHHYAMTLAAIGNRVWFLQPPGAAEYEYENDPPQGVVLLADHNRFRGARYFPASIRKFIFRRIIRGLENEAGVHFDVIWNFDNSRFFDLDCFKNSFRIHHRMDFHYNFQNEKTCKSADLCLGVTSGIVESMKVYNRESYFINHGYATPEVSSIKLPASTAQHKALYIGNLFSPFINWTWIHALVNAEPEVHFYFAGSYSISNICKEVNEEALAEIKLLKPLKNVTFLGEKHPSEIYAFMNEVDILFASYDSMREPEILANSHKIMGYLGSGKPVVCHEIGEYMRYPELLYMAKTKDEYLELFRFVKTNLQTTSDEIHQSKRISFAHKNTYLQQIKLIDELITRVRK